MRASHRTAAMEHIEMFYVYGVEYTFGISLMDDGTPKIVLHHSSLLYTPG